MKMVFSAQYNSKSIFVIRHFNKKFYCVKNQISVNFTHVPPSLQGVAWRLVLSPAYICSYNCSSSTTNWLKPREGRGRLKVKEIMQGESNIVINNDLRGYPQSHPYNAYNLCMRNKGGGAGHVENPQRGKKTIVPPE